MTRLLNIVAICLIAAAAKADVFVYDVSLNTSPLVGNPNGPFALDFQLTSGDTTSGVVNSAALSLFAFGAGGSAGTGNPFSNSGNASGNLGSSVALSTAGGTFFSEFSQYFTPGSSLNFQLSLTNSPQPTGTPDEFTFQLIDNTLGEVSTTDPSGSDSLIIIDLTGPGASPQIFTTDGDGITITPQLATVGSTVPEPSGIWLCVPVAVALLGYSRRKMTRVA
jgi:hypothetical protein